MQRVARWGDGWLPNRVTASRVEEATRILETLAVERGRDPKELSISVFGQPVGTTKTQVNELLNAGAVRVSVWANHCETNDAMAEELEGMAEALIK